MKNISTTFFLLCSFFCFAQPNIDSLLIETELGKQYLTLNLENNPSLGKSYYAIIQPVFETYFDTIPQKKANIPDTVNIEFITKIIDIKPAFLEWKYRITKDSFVYNYLKRENLENSEALLISLTETPKQYQTIMICSKEYEMYNKYVPFEKQRLISVSTIKKLSSKNEILHPNQIVIEVSNGKWFEFKEVLVPLYSQTNKIIELQRALIKNGYHCKVTGEVDTETKAALLQFQKDNNFGQPGIGGTQELLKKLGLGNF